MSTHPFEKEFDRVIVAFRRSQAEADHKFLDAAGASVKAAIRFYGEAVARETRALDALRRARSFLDRVGDEYPTRLAAVLAATDELRSLVLSEAERGRNGDNVGPGEHIPRQLREIAYAFGGIRMRSWAFSPLWT